MGLNFLRHIGTMGYPAAGAGGVTRLELPRVALWHRLHLLLRNTVTVSGGGGTPLTEEPQSLLRSIDIIANGSNVIKSFDGGTLYRLNEFHHGNVMPRDPVGGFVTAEISVSLVIDFSMPLCVRPIDTIFDSRKWSLLECRIVWGDENDLLSSASGTWTLSDLTLDVAVEESVGLDVNAGIFAERMISRTFTSLTGEQDIELPVGDFYRAITLKTTDNTNPEDALVKLVTLMSGGTRFVDGVGWGDTDAATQLRGTLNGYNAAMFNFDGGAPPVGYRRLEFCPDGLLTESLDTSVLEELKLRVDLGTVADTGTVSAVTHTIVNPAFVRG